MKLVINNVGASYTILNVPGYFPTGLKPDGSTVRTINGTFFAVYGTAANTVMQGDDSRLITTSIILG